MASCPTLLVEHGRHVPWLFGSLQILLQSIERNRIALPVSPLPQVDFPVISVSANIPGASPETMAASVATPLERQFTTISGVDSMTSTNSLGNTNITLQFDLNRSSQPALPGAFALLLSRSAGGAYSLPGPDGHATRRRSAPGAARPSRRPGR